MTTTVRTDDVDVQLLDLDRTRPFLLLHGGAGPTSMAGFGDLLAHRLRARVLLPTHPGFAGTVRPDSVASTKDLAATYVALLDRLELDDVTLIGNSFGGWVAAEMALLDSPRITGAVIIDGIGIDVPEHPVTDLRGLAPEQRTALSFHDPSTAPSPAAAAGADGTAPVGLSPDLQDLAAYAGPTNTDPTLLERLRGLDLPVHVIWGASDGIVDVEYGRAYADALPRSSFTVLARSGHFPQIETPEALLAAIVDLER